MSRPAISLIGCAEKISRASRHADEFKRAMFAFLDQRPYKAVPEHDKETGEFVGTLTKDVPDCPIEWGPIIGDVAHNLMSALDHLVCQLAIANGGDGRCLDTEFPIFISEDAYRKHAKVKRLALGDECLLRDLQPYQGRDEKRRPRLHALWLLREINVIDKHRRLHVTAVAMAQQMIEGIGVKGVEIVDARAWEGRKAGDEILRFRIKATGTEPPEGQVNLSVSPHIEFAEGSGDLTGVQVAGLIDGIFAHLRDEVFPKVEGTVGKLPDTVRFSQGRPGA